MTFHWFLSASLASRMVTRCRNGGMRNSFILFVHEQDTFLSKTNPFFNIKNFGHIKYIYFRFKASGLFRNSKRNSIHGLLPVEYIRDIDFHPEIKLIASNNIWIRLWSALWMQFTLCRGNECSSISSVVLIIELNSNKISSKVQQKR